MASPKSAKKKPAKAVQTRKIKKSYPIESAPEPQPLPQFITDQKTPKAKNYRTPVMAVFLVLAIALLILVKNGLLVSAVVNGSPIFSWQLYGRLASRFGAQTLEGMITEKLIADASRAAGVNVSQEDIESRQNEMLKSVGDSIRLEDLLKYQGMTKEDFQGQLKLQLAVERILAKDIKITDNEINQYLASYSAQMVATDDAGLKSEAEKAIFDQQVSEKVNDWFAELKNKARIMRFL